MTNEVFCNRRKQGNSCSQSLLLQNLETCLDMSESEQESIKGGQDESVVTYNILGGKNFGRSLDILVGSRH
jgi:hypothetical protein